MTERQELFAKADKLGLDYKKNASSDDIAVLIEEAEMAKKAEGYDEPAEVVAEKAEVKPKSEPKKVSGAKPSNVLKPMKAQKGKTLMAANRLIRCIITPLDEAMRTISSEMYSVGSPSTGFVKKVIRFNEETIEPAILVNHLRGKKMLLQQETGKGVQVKMKRVPAFSIQILKDYTPKEIEELFAKGKASNK